MQRPGRLVVAIAKEVRAYRLRERRVVELDRDIVSGLFAGAFPAGANLGAVLVTGVNAVVRRILRFARICRHNGDIPVEAERVDAPAVASLLACEFPDLLHVWLLCSVVR